MKIYISEEDLICNIQERFREVYPGLKVEFYKHPHVEGQRSAPEDQYPPEQPIEDIRMIHCSGWIDVSPGRRVADLEKDFHRCFGLSAQIFRRSGNTWVETIHTDHWTLEQQNEEAGHMYSRIKEKPEDFGLADVD